MTEALIPIYCVCAPLSAPGTPLRLHLLPLLTASCPSTTCPAFSFIRVSSLMSSHLRDRPPIENNVSIPLHLLIPLYFPHNIFHFLTLYCICISFFFPLVLVILPTHRSGPKSRNVVLFSVVAPAPRIDLGTWSSTSVYFNMSPLFSLNRQP